MDRAFNFGSDSALRALNTYDFWRQLAPNHHLSERHFDGCDPPYALDIQRVAEARASLAEEGYLLVPEVLDKPEVARAAALVQRVTSAGLPAPFAMVYDDI